MSEASKELRRAMAGAMKSLLGTGYVDDYYSSNASDFVMIAECYADHEVEAAKYRPWRGRLTWYPFTEVEVFAEKAVKRSPDETALFLWALDDLGEPYTLRADCVERINP